MCSLPRHPLHLIKTEMCRFGKSCSKSVCSYAHTSSELRRKIPEEEFCRSWTMFGKCPFGDRCRFQKGHITATHQAHIDKVEPKKEPVEKIEKDEPIKTEYTEPIIEQSQTQEYDDEYLVLTCQQRTMSFVQQVVIPYCIPDLFARFPQLDRTYPFFDYETRFFETIDWDSLTKCESTNQSLLKDLLEYGKQRTEFMFVIRVVIMCLTGAVIVKKSNLKD